MKLSAIIDACLDRGIRSLGISDHIGAATNTGILAQARRELASVKTTMRVLIGCEADLLDVGRLMVTDEMKSSLDFISVAANHFHLKSVAQPKDDSPETIGRHFLEFLRYACSLDFVDFIAHPMYVYPKTFDPTFLEIIQDDAIMDVLQVAKKNDIAMEISPRSLDREQLHFRMRFLFLCKEAGLKFSIGSDAHRLEMIGSIRMLAPIVRELDLTDEDIWLPREAG